MSTMLLSEQDSYMPPMHASWYDPQNTLDSSSFVDSQLEVRREIFSTLNEQNYWDELEPAEKREIYKLLCRRIVIVNGTLRLINLYD